LELTNIEQITVRTYSANQANRRWWNRL